MSSEPAIQVANVSKVYDLGLSGRTSSFATIIRERLRHPISGGGAKRERFHALDDVSFDVAHGEVVGMIGKNGAGKSTMLKILSRITQPSDGYIDMAGSVGSLLEVGVGFHPELTGLENVFLNGTILGMSKREIDRRLDEICDFAEVHKFIDTPVKRYSSGMRVRLAFAVAAHLDPEILMIDEVLSVGDSSFQLKCLEKMRSIASDQGRTVLYVSHNLVTVEHLCRRTLLLVDGRLTFDGPTEEALSQYLNLSPQGMRGHAAGLFDLAAADRSGAGYEKVFKRLAFRPSGGLPSDTIRMGERLQVEIAVEGLDAIPKAMAQVTVGSSLNDVLFRMSSRMIPLEAAHPRRTDETIVLDIPSLPLVPGDYYLDVQLHGEQAHSEDAVIVDSVHRAAEFTVMPSDVLGTGYRFASRDGNFMVPFGWEIRPSNPEA